MTESRSTVDESADVTSVTDADSSSFPAPRPAPSLGADLGRTGVCIVLVAIMVAAPPSAVLFAPFVTLLVALRLLRHRTGRERFFATTVAACALVAATDAPGGTAGQLAAVSCVVLLAGGLALAHVRAARRDPVTMDEHAVDWPEPRLDTGMSLAVGAWLVACAVTFVVLVGASGQSVATAERDAVRELYASYVRDCADGGAWERLDNPTIDAYCEQLLTQRRDVLDVVRTHPREVAAVLVALVAMSSALTVHLLVLLRGARTSSRIRPRWRLRELEVHWSSAYCAAIGIVGWLAIPDHDGVALAWVRAVALGIGAVGGTMIALQGLGLVAWILTRRASPAWYRVLLAVGAVVAFPFAAGTCFVLGVIDLALHPRRRALDSASLPPRGSGS